MDYQHDIMTRLAIFSGKLNPCYYRLVAQNYNLFEIFRNRQIQPTPQNRVESKCVGCPLSLGRFGEQRQPQDMKAYHLRQIRNQGRCHYEPMKICLKNSQQKTGLKKRNV